MTLLSRLLALANRPGTPAEGEQARRAAERVAARNGLRILELTNGHLTTAKPLDEELEDLLRRLDEIAHPPERDQIGDDGGR